MAAPVATSPKPQIRSAPRAAIAARTLRNDRWWVAPLISFGVLTAFVVYATWAAFVNGDYFARPYLSPFYSPCLATICGGSHGHIIHGALGAPKVGVLVPGGPSPRPSSS